MLYMCETWQAEASEGAFLGTTGIIADHERRIEEHGREFADARE